jgi:hypothetical protein
MPASRSGDQVEERAGHPPAPRSGLGHGCARGIAHLGQRRVVLRQDRAIVELVPAQRRARRQRAHRRQQPRRAIAQVQPPLGMAGFQPEQPGHGMARACLVDQPLPQYHVAAAFAVDRAGLRMVAQASQKPRGRREPSGMQFGIAARQPDHVGLACRGFVGQRRKRQDLRARRLPALQQMRIEERERRICATASRCAGAAAAGKRGARLRALWFSRSQRHQRGKIDMPAHEIRQAIERTGQVGMLQRLHQPQVPLGQGEIGPARQRAQHRQADPGHPVAQQAFVARAGHLVENHPGHAHLRIEPGKAQRGGRRRLRLARGIEHQHHRPAQPPRHVGTGANAQRAGAGHAVEQAHRGFGQGQIGPRRLRRKAVDQCAPHRPAIEIERGAARGGAMEGRVDIVRAVLERLHRQPVLRQGAQQAECQRGLARARTGRGNHQAGHCHAVAPCGRKRRS